jgi:hypothetical protein
MFKNYEQEKTVLLTSCVQISLKKAILNFYMLIKISKSIQSAKPKQNKKHSFHNLDFFSYSFIYF